MLKIKLPGYVTRGKRLLTLVLLILLIVTGVFIIFSKENNKVPALSVPAHNVEEGNSKLDQKLLESKDYDTYQTSLIGYADSYLSAKDYKNSERVLKEILHNVPNEQVSISTYASLVRLYTLSSDKANKDKYCNVIIARLKQQGDDYGVKYYQNIRDGKPNKPRPNQDD